MARSRANCGSKRPKSLSKLRSRSRAKSKSSVRSSSEAKTPCGNRNRSRVRKRSNSKSKKRCSKKRSRQRRRAKSMSPKCPKPVDQRPKLPRTKSCGRSSAKESKSESKVPTSRKTTQRPRDDKSKDCSDSNPEAPVESKILSPPLVSTRDPNHYRIIELDNGVRALLISTCGYGTEAAGYLLAADEKKDACAPHPPTSVFNRKRGKRDRSDEDKEQKKRVARRASAQIKTCNKKHPDNASDVPKAEEPEIGGGFFGIFNPGAGAEPPAVAPPAAADKPVDADPDAEFQPEAEPKDEKLRRAACNYVRRRFPQVEVALTIGCGSLYDPPNLRGLSNLTWMAIQRALKNSKIDARRDEINTVNATIITVSTTGEKLGQTLNTLANKVVDLATNRKDILKDIDEIDQIEEVVQCFFCWSDPMEDERRQALLCSLAKEDHPIRRVSYRGYPPDLWEAEVKTDLVKQINNFLAENYLGKSMTVAVKAAETLDDLAKLVTDAFYQVPGGDLGDFPGGKEPFDTPEFYQFYRVKCTNPGCCDTGDAFLVISWALPPELWENDEVKPLEYISALISSKTPGGLTHRLKEMKLSTGVEASCRDTGFHRNQFYSFFEIQIRLTEAGFSDYGQVIETVFSYIHFMRSSGPQEELYVEMQRIRDTQFNALGQEVDLEDPYPTSATKISYWLQVYEAQNVMMGPFLMKDYSPEVLQESMDLLVPDKANYMLCSCFEEPVVKLSKVEPVYNTMYDVRDLTDAELGSWTNASASAEFDFPEPNEFISRGFCQSKAETDSKEPQLYDPEKPVNYRIWIQNNIDHMHFTMQYVHVISSEAFSGPENAVMLNVWYLCLKDILEPLLYQATVADIHYSIQPTHHGLLISVYSWNHHCAKALAMIISEIGKAGKNVSEDLFMTKKREWLRHLSGDMKDIHFSSHFVSHDLYETVTVLDHWPSAFLYNELKEIDLEEFREFAQEFCERSTCVAILRGNVVTDNAASLAEVIEETFPNASGVMEDFQVRMLELPIGDRILRLKSYSEYGGDSHVTNFYQIGPADSLSRLCGIFIQHLLSREMTKDLKNREAEKLQKLDKSRGKKKGKGRGTGQESRESEQMNTGDEDDWLWMTCDLRMNQGIMTLCCHCEGCSPRYNVDDLECQLDTFLKQFLAGTLCPMGDNKREFNTLRTCLQKTFMSHIGGYQELCTELDCLFEAMKSLTFRFNEVQCMLACLKTLRVTDIQNWFNDHCMDKGCAFRKLSVQLVPKPRQPDPPASPSKTPLLLPPKNKQEWRARRKRLRDCTYKDYHRIIHLHKPDKDETFQLLLEAEETDEKTCGNDYFISDWAGFKLELMEFPDDVADC